MTFTGVTVGPCYLFYLPQRSRNGPKIEILRAKMYATPSRNMFGSCLRLISSLYVYQNRRYSWNFKSPLKVSTLLAFTELGSAPEGKFLAIWGALAGQYGQVSTSLSPIGWNLSAFELASKYVS